MVSVIAVAEVVIKIGDHVDGLTTVLIVKNGI